MKSLAGTWFARSLEHLAGVVFRHPKLLLYPQLLLTAACIWYTAFSPWHLQFDTSRDNLVGANKKYHRNFLQFRKEFPEQDDLVVVVESENAEKNRQFVERLGAKLEAETNLFKDVFYKGDLKMMGNKALLFVPEPDLEDLRQTLKSYRPFIDQFTKATNLVSLFNLVNTQFRTAKREENAENASLVRALPALERIVREAEDCLLRPGTPPSPGINAFFGAGPETEQQMYITFADGRIYLVTTHATNAQATEQAVKRLRQLMVQTQSEVPGVNVGATGEPILEIDEMAQSERDTLLATVVSLVLVFIIIVYGYGKISRRLKADLCLLVGMAYTMAFTTLTIGHLNILTITFAPILIGLAIDFGVHLITRFEEELRRGRSEQEAMTKAMVFTGQGIFTGAFTTAGAFLAMGLTDFKGIQEMGIICGGGMLVCLVPMMTMLPVMLLGGRTNVVSRTEGDPFARRARIESLWLGRPVTVVAVTLVLCGLAVTQFPKVEFDYNLLDMQSKNLPAVVFEKKLISSASKSVLFGAVLADSLDEANAIEAKVKKLPAVSSIESMSGYLTEDQTRKLRIIGEIKQEVAPIRFAEYDTGPVRVNELSTRLYYLQGYCSWAADEAGKDDPSVARQLLSLRDAIIEFRKQMLADPQAAAEKVAAFQQALFKDIFATFQALANQDNRGPLRADDLPAALRNRFVGVTGKYLIQVYPKEDIWKRENQKEFVHELRQALTPNDMETSDKPALFKGLIGKLKRLAGVREADDSTQTVKPIITGTPVQLYEYTSLLVNSYIEAALYSLGAIILLVLFHFRTLSSLVLALIPVAVGSVWLGGIMGHFGIPLNPANIMTLPLVIGIGVTNGIHILNRFAEEKTPGILAKSTGKAVLVSGLTAIAGFGSLILGKHQGIQSLGLVMSIGIATCMIAGMAFLPAVMSLMSRTGGRKKQPSADNALSTLGREEPR
jgi:uncharacterized protein